MLSAIDVNYNGGIMKLHFDPSGEENFMRNCLIKFSVLYYWIKNI